MNNRQIEEIIAGIINDKTNFCYRLLLTFSGILTALWLIAIIYTFSGGLGVWGIGNQISWAFCITNFVFWIGIAHSGTLISAILFLFGQSWRKSLNRAAEAMTIIAVMIAATFPLIHTGRPWFSAYWLVPYPSSMDMWVNFKSPLIWDFFAIFSYFAVSLMFWYLGMIPDLALLKSKVKSGSLSALYKFFSFGWRGSSGDWKTYKRSYTLFAGMASALVISVHSIVSYDFAVTNVAGWHITIFPPYFVAGAILSGCSFVTILLLLSSKLFKLEGVIGKDDLESLQKVTLTASLLVAYSYAAEFFQVIYTGNFDDYRALWSRTDGSNAFTFSSMFILNAILPNLLWFKKMRRSSVAASIISTGILTGMWLERFSIVVGSLGADYLPENIGIYSPTWVEISLLAGSFGAFLFLYLIIIKVVPVVSIYELND